MSQPDAMALLSVAYSGTKEERTAATAQLEGLLQSPDGPYHLLTLMRAGVDTTLPPQQSLSALIYAKNCLLHIVPEELIAGVDGLVAEMESILFEGMFRVPDSHRRIICTCALTLISAYEWDYLDALVPMMQGFSEAVSGEQALAALELLYTYVKRYNTPGLEPMRKKVKVCRALLPVIASYVHYNDFRVTRYAFKVMWCISETMLQLTDTKELPAAALDGCFEVLLQFPVANYEGAKAVGGKAYEEYVKCVKRAAVITFGVLNDATRRKKPAPMASHFLKHHSAGFYHLWSQWLETCVSTPGLNHDLHQKSEMFAIRFIKLCTLDETLYSGAMAPNAMQLIERLLFPFLCYNDTDEEVFADTDNLSEFVLYMMDEGVGNGELTQRQAASNTILAMVGGKKPFHNSAALLQSLVGTLNTGLALPDSEENYPRLFGFLHLLSILRKYIRLSGALWQQMAQVLMHYVAPRAQAHIPFCALRCKAIVVCQRFSKVPMPSESDYASFIQMMCHLVDDKDARVRLAAIDAMCTLLEMRRARPYLRPFLIPLVEESLTFLNRVHTTYVPTVILHLTTHFAAELTPVMGRLGHTLVQTFLASAFDLAQQENADGDAGGVDVSYYDQVAFSSDALLDAIYTIVTSCHQNPATLQELSGDILQLIRRVLEEPECFDYIQKALAIFTHFVMFSKPFPTASWELLPLLFQSVRSGMGVDFFAEIEEVLDNFISQATAEYLTNQTVMELTFEACQKMLIGGVSCSAQCQFAPAQLIEAMLHQAKALSPSEATQLFDGSYYGRYVSLLLQALLNPDIQNGDVKIRVWVIAALMDCFYYNPPAALDVFVNVGAFPQFFDQFFAFFAACISDSNVDSLDAPSPGDANARTSKKCGKKKMKDRSPSICTPESLSILNRKTITLGLSSLLHFALDATNRAASPPLHAFLQSYLEPSLRLIWHCLAANRKVYEARNAVTAETIGKVRRGEEDEIEDVDMTDEQVLGLDGGDDVNGIADDDADFTGEDLEEAEEDAMLRDAALEYDEGDDYESPVDDINEAQFFIDAVCAGAAAEVQGVLHRVVGDPSALSTAAQVAGQYRQLGVELEAVLAQEFESRAQS